MINDLYLNRTNSNGLPPVGNNFPEVEAQNRANGFGRVWRTIGSIVGGAAGFVIPGAAGIIGSLIGGTGGNYSSYMGLMEQQRNFMEMQRYSQLSAAMQQQQQQQMMNQQQQQSMQLISVQQRVGMQAQEFTTISNLLKTRHDSEMSAVNNIKS